MTGGILMTGYRTELVTRSDGPNGYALASERARCILRRLWYHWESDLAPSMSSDLEAFSH